MNEKTELSDERIKELAEQQGSWGACFGYSKESYFEKPVVPAHAYTFARAIEAELSAASPSSKSTKEAELREALHAAATSLETISFLAGRKSYGDPPIPTYMDTFLDVRSFAANRATVARAALASSSIKEDGERARPCPAAGIMGEHACANRDQCWEPCGELGNDPKHVRVASEKDTAAINKALGLSSPPSHLGDTPDQQEQKR